MLFVTPGNHIKSFAIASVHAQTVKACVSKGEHHWLYFFFSPLCIKLVTTAESVFMEYALLEKRVMGWVERHMMEWDCMIEKSSVCVWVHACICMYVVLGWQPARLFCRGSTFNFFCPQANCKTSPGGVFSVSVLILCYVSLHLGKWSPWERTLTPGGV